MPPRRRIARQAQLQPQQSDYETDTANLTDNNQQQQQYKLDMSVLPQRSAEELNMLVLRRWYPSISTILAIAPFATLYLYPPDSQVWTKCDTEGVLFVVELQPDQGLSHPRYRVIILNRKSMENFVLDLTTTDNIEITDEYVIVQVPDEEGREQIFGIWIFSDKNTVPDTRQVVAGTIMDCARRAEEYASYREQEQDERSYQTSDEVFQPAIFMQQQQAPNQYGQQVDLSTFFARPQAQVGSYSQSAHDGLMPPQPDWPQANLAPSHAHPAQQHGSVDHMFHHQQQNVPTNAPTGHSQQSNSLLDLFKNASKLS